MYISLYEIESRFHIDLSQLKIDCENHGEDATCCVLNGGCWFVTLDYLMSYIEKLNDCRLCRELNHLNFDILLKLGMLEDTVIKQYKSWVVTPALGSFVPGYIMLINKNHAYSSTACCPIAQCEELEDVIMECKKVLMTIYKKNCIVFEHGVLEANVLCANSINHAHLHIIPIECDLYDDFSSYNYCKVNSLTELKKVALSNNVPYLYYESNGGCKYYIKDINNHFSSQFFRRKVAKVIGKPNSWNWKLHPFLEEFVNTYNRLIGRI